MKTRTRLFTAVAACLLTASAAAPASATAGHSPTDDGTRPGFLAMAPLPPKTIIGDPAIKLAFDSPVVTSTPTVDTQLRVALQSGSFTRIGGLLDHPVPSSVLTSPFAFRINPISGAANEFHTGQDYGAGCGTNVQTAANGTVVFAGWHPGGGGHRVEVDHGNGLKTTYNHLTGYHVSPGQYVARGESIASVGTTGSSTGCHLHFEVWRNGEVIDPLNWL